MAHRPREGHMGQVRAKTLSAKLEVLYFTGRGVRAV
jgi:hypothetical protein